MDLFSIKEVFLAESKKIWKHYLIVFVISTLGVFFLLKNKLLDFLLKSLFTLNKGDLYFFNSLFYILMILIPILVFINSYNVISQAINSKNIRFIISKMERSSYFIGLILSHSFMYFIFIKAYMIFFYLTTYFKYSKNILYLSILFGIFFTAYSFSLVSLSFLVSSVFRNHPLLSIILSFVIHVIIFSLTFGKDYDFVSIFFIATKGITLASLIYGSIILMIHGLIYLLISIAYIKVIDV